MQHLEVMADRRLGQIERPAQVAGVRFSAGMRGYQRHQAQPDRIGQRLEQRRDLLGSSDRAWADSGEQHAAVFTGSSTTKTST
jgi:hypothetical protein